MQYEQAIATGCCLASPAGEGVEIVRREPSELVHPQFDESRSLRS
jgi:hypothetical protein